VRLDYSICGRDNSIARIRAEHCTIYIRNSITTITTFAPLSLRETTRRQRIEDFAGD
jgi:hypothetical protein